MRGNDSSTSNTCKCKGASAAVLQGKVAIVTGAARGIGRAIAERLQAEGVTVVLNDIDEQQLVRTHAEGVGHQTVVADISARGDVERLIAATVSSQGRLDIVVNNAGVEPKASLLDMSDDDWNRALAVNLTGTFLCTQVAARQMVRQGQGGRIIQISSIAGKNVLPNAVNYCAAKAGVIGFTREAARELASYGITVNTICPGVIETEMTAAARENPEVMARWMREIPARRLGNPEEVAALVAFLASDQAAYVTAQAWNVDGGKVPW